MCKNFSNILQVKILLNAFCHLQDEETIMKMCSTHVEGVLPANMAPQLKQTLLPTSPEHGPVKELAPAPCLVWSYITVMFLQNVEF